MPKMPREQPPKHVCRVHVWPALQRLGERTVEGWFATTIGPHIFAARPLTPPELAHERTHVAQWHRYGLSLLWRYPRAAFLVWRGGGRPYWDNPFEIEAYRVQARTEVSERSSADARQTTPSAAPN